MADVTGISGTTNPYEGLTYKAASTDKNTLSITSYIQLLATQLQNQDMTDPMDSNDMMAQLTQMAMVQSLSTMTEALENSVAMNTTTYAASLVGKGVTVAVTDTNNTYGTPVVVGSKYGVVESINLSGDSPTFRLQNDPTDYPLTYLMGIGDITTKPPTTDGEDNTGTEGVGGTGNENGENTGVEGSTEENGEGTQVEGSTGENGEGNQVEGSGEENTQGTEGEGSTVGGNTEESEVEGAAGENAGSSESGGTVEGNEVTNGENGGNIVNTQPENGGEKSEEETQTGIDGVLETSGTGSGQEGN